MEKEKTKARGFNPAQGVIAKTRTEARGLNPAQGWNGKKICEMCECNASSC